MRTRTTRTALLAATTAGALVAGLLTTVVASAAAVGCRVDYRVTNQWGGGFGADVAVTNLGDPVTGWTLTWSFTAGQQVDQAWNATVTQSADRVTARDVGYNAVIGTGGTTSFGFNASWHGTANPAPASFALNGTTCTGATPTTPPGTTPPPTTPPPTTPPPTTPPPPRRRPGPSRWRTSTGG
ncbi:cellulose binding domain-containing protein [Micromonospora echinospora]|uniref:cellulose binding domain-containing protein n=1 Tax=Micromonospora echinospora TaxID=1877 RepID=UPI003A85CEAB